MLFKSLNPEIGQLSHSRMDNRSRRIIRQSSGNRQKTLACRINSRYISRSFELIRNYD
jgi:hypothetical protein